MPTDVAGLCDAIEECYEFMLAYAGRGVPSEEGSEVRDHLQRAADALVGLEGNYSKLIGEEGLEPIEKYQAFLAVLARDASDSLAAIELVLVQPVISSQLIDNLNASIHLRALLTDLFLVDEILSAHRRQPSRPTKTA